MVSTLRDDCRYRLLHVYEVDVSKDESDQVADLRYSWRKLLSLSNEVNNTLAELQVGFKKELVRNVKLFVADVEKFRLDFQTNGPMVTGISTVEATERLKKFQLLYEQRERKFKTYRSGEILRLSTRLLMAFSEELLSLQERSSSD